MCLFAAAAIPAVAGIAGEAGMITAGAITAGTVAAGGASAALTAGTVAAGAATAAAATTPLWLKALYVGTSIGSTIMNMNAGKQATSSKAAMYDYQAKVAKQNADEALKYGDINSRINQTQASQESKALMKKLGAIEGEQKAAIGALKIGGATAEDIVGDTFYKGRADQIALKYRADLDSWKYKTDAANKAWAYNQEAGQYGLAASNYRKTSKTNNMNSLLSGIASTALGVMTL